MYNSEIKAKITKHRLYRYEIAAKIGITEFTLSRWLTRSEMSAEQLAKVEAAIDELLEGGD